MNKLYYQIISVLLVLVSAPIAYKARFLDASGTLAASLLGVIVGVTQGPVFLLLLMLFLGTNSVFTKIGYVKKALAGAAEPKGGARTWRSVVANGLVATIFAVLGVFSHSLFVIVGMLAALSAASADTTATEIGLLSNSKPRLITDWSEVAAGTSGGVTSLGFFGAFLGAAIMALTSVILVFFIWPRLPNALFSFDPVKGSVTKPWSYAFSVLIGGFCGSIFDSVLGATVQAKYKCVSCSALTEKRKVHCNKPVRFYSGVRWIDNDFVNLISCFAGSAVGLLSFLLLR
ncbi:hypothetical protein B9Q11_03805 [Candidatus Marsarchaeota G2 archaeon ECH_B_SAG-F08]|uniref:DUF92 domain-containing protein n=3 Tax=Candidatus Marsarchaeota group 2 TaxID=2203771 RepID=A0A2R6BG18_9ARCH|nr:MAG: hypothetical protein B9Q11_03805 [Candidatus Marsarchaeota G2 archaeon ECH_B_SAG-F08]PSO03614.1 MAG: hypothetical protein B9Q10_00420 [Candidatus Marsarchaeota G2 archaeon ECH_B_SAG-E12]PSO03991.1 MAG: hypothetical protein B9Q13_05865 [Candidatus Marsarchaeota G2 archaeon ECH_B_SAG-G16]